MITLAQIALWLAAREDVRECGPEGAKMEELQQVLPSKSRAEIKRLLAELRQEGRVALEGKTRNARW